MFIMFIFATNYLRFACENAGKYWHIKRYAGQFPKLIPVDNPATALLKEICKTYSLFYLA